MKIVEIEVQLLHEAPWNANKMDPEMEKRLKESLRRFDLVLPLVVRPLEQSRFEVLSGNQRFRVMREAGFKMIPCVVVQADDSQAMLLAQSLNQIHGQDDPVKKGILLKKILNTVPENQILSLLPETVRSLRALSSLDQEELAEYLKVWEKSRTARLKHMQIQLSNEQLKTIEEALEHVMVKAKRVRGSNPNIKGTAIYLLAQFYLERRRK
jgi:ParB family chromosome partitioning protein